VVRLPQVCVWFCVHAAGFVGEAVVNKLGVQTNVQKFVCPSRIIEGLMCCEL